jgi:hypothetical protein
VATFVAAGVAPPDDKEEQDNEWWERRVQRPRARATAEHVIEQIGRAAVVILPPQLPEDG